MGLFGGSKKKALKKLAKRQEAAGRAYQQAVQFRPVGTTNAFGTTQYTYNPQGQLETAGYQLDPRLSALTQAAITSAGDTGLQFANQATQSGLGLTNLGAQYIAQSPEEAAAKYMQQQQALLQPGQDYARAQLNQGLFNTGRGGLSVEQGGGIGAANPEATVYYNALARQQAEMALNADLYGRQRVAFGADLTKSGLGLGVGAYDPMKANLVAAQGVEGLGQDVLNRGLSMGQLRTAAATTGAEGNLQGTLAGAQSRYQAAMTPSFGQSVLGGLANMGLNYATGGLGGLGNWVSSNLFGPQQATYSELSNPANMGFYGSATQPSSGYSGLSWNQP